MNVAPGVASRAVKLACTFHDEQRLVNKFPTTERSPVGSKRFVPVDHKPSCNRRLQPSAGLARIQIVGAIRRDHRPVGKSPINDPLQFSRAKRKAQ